MSHNVVASGVQFTDLTVLASAVAALVKREGVEATFEYNADSKVQMRGYYRSEPVDAVIKLPGERYDVGFQKQADGSFVPYFESNFRPRGFAASHTAKPIEGAQMAKATMHNNVAANLGKLVQEYTLQFQERNARRLGLTCRRVANTTNGQIALEIQ